MEFIDKTIRTHGALVGRMLIGLLFVFSGVGIVLNGVDGFVGMIDARGLPVASLLGWLLLIIKIIGGMALILGYKTEQAALARLVFTILATVL